MINKDLYGIDPDALYPWSPKAAYRDTNEEKRDAAKFEMALDDFLSRPEEERKSIALDSLLPEALELIDGAPVVLVAPLTEKMALRVQSARQKSQRVYARAARRVSDRLGKLTAEQREGVEAEDIREEEIERATNEAAEVFSEEFEAEVLLACLRGWRNLKRPDGAEIQYPEEASKRIACLPSSWRSEIVHSIVTESMWSAEAVEGFGSRQESTKG